ncbi:MAG: hypothetical protein FJ041_07980, partial [Candidatus Cloacimonetes bacterium]|nr:hypothetical protein [Candidatus Cloacimonadota bacterium]
EFIVTIGAPNPQISRNGTGIYLSWQAVPGANAYRVYRSSSVDGEYILLATVNQLFYLDINSSNTALYKITAVFH